MSFKSKISSLLGKGSAETETAENIILFSISCGHMNYDSCYSFSLKKRENKWLFSASCHIDGFSDRIEFENKDASAETAGKLLDIVNEQGIIEKIRAYREPVLKFHAMDETTYYTAIVFSDNSEISAMTAAGETVEKFFYSLAKEYIKQ